MTLQHNEVQYLMKIFKNILEAQSQIADDYILDKLGWDEVNIEFKEHMLENLEESIYRNLGVV